MNGNNIENIIKSPAFTIIVGTVCGLIIMNQVPVMVKRIKEIREGG